MVLRFPQAFLTARKHIRQGMPRDGEKPKDSQRTVRWSYNLNSGFPVKISQISSRNVVTIFIYFYSLTFCGKHRLPKATCKSIKKQFTHTHKQTIHTHKMSKTIILVISLTKHRLWFPTYVTSAFITALCSTYLEVLFGQ